MNIENQREHHSIDRWKIAFSTPVECRRLAHKRIGCFTLLWSSVTMVALALTLSLLASTTSFAQQSTADQPRYKKGQTAKERKARRGRSKTKARKAARRNARDSQEAKSKEDQQSRASDRANGKNQTSAAQGGVDEADSANSASDQGLNEGDTTGQGVKTIAGALKGGATQRSNRMEFDARLVYGETAGSGAVILFERGQRHLPPLTKQRTTFLSATTEPIFGKKEKSRNRERDDSKEAKSDKTETESVNDGHRD